MNMLGFSSSVHFTHTTCYCTRQKSSVSTGFTEQIMPILRILCYNGSLVIWMIVSLTTDEFKPLVLYREHIHIHIHSHGFVWLLLVACTILLYECWVRIRVTLRLAVYCHSANLGDKPLETHDQYFFFKSTVAVTVLMSHPLWREDWSVIYNCCWFSPAQSFSGPSTARQMNTCYYEWWWVSTAPYIG
jgi:hypothetical protein